MAICVNPVNVADDVTGPISIGTAEAKPPVDNVVHVQFVGMTPVAVMDSSGLNQQKPAGFASSAVVYSSRGH